ncbi:MAG TPA: hypothetical protein VF072_01490 [Thermoleophilaceae bacterium]
MKSLLRRRPSPAMIVASLALFVSLSGVSYGVATGFIDSREIKNNEVRSIDIRNNEIRTRDLRNNEVRGIDIRNSTVQGRDIALNTVTGEDVREDTLQKVPSALLADSATSADGVKSLKIVDTTIQRDAPSATLATSGPLTLLGSCIQDLSSTNAGVSVDTSEDGTIVGDQHNDNKPVDATDPPWPLWGISDTMGDDDRTAAFTTFHATAASGPAMAGTVSIQALATSGSTGTCRFQGFVVLPR